MRGRGRLRSLALPVFSHLFAVQTRPLGSLLLGGGGLCRRLGRLGDLATRLHLVDDSHDDHDDGDGQGEEDQDVPIEGLDLLGLVAERESVAGSEDGTEPEEVEAGHCHHGNDSELAQRHDAADDCSDSDAGKVSGKHEGLLRSVNCKRAITYIIISFYSKIVNIAS